VGLNHVYAPNQRGVLLLLHEGLQNLPEAGSQKREVYQANCGSLLGDFLT